LGHWPPLKYSLERRNVMGLVIEEVEVKKDGKTLDARAAVPVMSLDEEGLRAGVDHFGGGDKNSGLAKIIGFANSAVRVAEAGKVRAGTDPVKAARNSVTKLTPEARAALLAELSAEM
jgi:hypothetical protein